HAAITHCRAALDVAAHLGTAVSATDRAEIEEMLAAAHLWVGAFRESGEAFARAAEATEDVQRRAGDLAWSGHSFVSAKEWDTATGVIGEAAALADAHHIPAAQALAFAVRSFGEVVREGNLDSYPGLASEALALAVGTPHEDVQGLALFMVGEAHEWRGDYEEAIAFEERALAIGRRIGHPFLMVMPSWWLGKAHTGLGRYETALAYLREAGRFGARLGARAWQSRLLNTLGWALAELGDDAAARPYNVEASRIAHELGDAEILANADINLAMNLLGLGDVDAAAATLAPIEAAAAKPGDPWMRWRYTLHIRDAAARIALARRGPDGRPSRPSEGIAGPRRPHAGRLEARALAVRAQALSLLDRRADAERAAKASLELAARLRYPAAQWRMLALLAELATRAGRRPDA